MNPRYEAAWELHQFLTERGIPYAIIGGTALPRWGDSRYTQDVDLTVLGPLSEDSASFVRLVLTGFQSRDPDPFARAKRDRVVLIRASNGCPVDISLGMPIYEDELVGRAVEFELEPGKRVRVASAEDLIIHKIVAGRPQDLLDVENIILRQRRHLDVQYIHKWLDFFERLAENPVFLKRFESLWQTKPPKRPTRKKGSSQISGVKCRKHMIR